ncbi:MAG: T9SS type A sorting domain-containing protein [Gemmatimonadetes bacterium]|nr:T9SS type A sorting domain-containing protein [Gemmatimonadota bacterium]
MASFVRWQLKDVALWKPFSAKLAAGTRLLSKLPDGLGDPFPMPFNAEVTIPFALAEAGPVRLTVYNLMGQQVRVLADSWVAAGAHRVRWDGRTDAGADAASGVYWAVLQAGGAVQTAKLVLIR